MDVFNLPNKTFFNRVIPKYAFDEQTNSKQKKLISDAIQRITWTNKLSPDTVNLPGKEIIEIQLFKIELKIKSDISKLIQIIDRAIPYPIIFWVQHNDIAYLSASSKHAHATNENIAIVDWTFTSEWFQIDECLFKINLKKDLDEVFKDFCEQLTGRENIKKQTLEEVQQNEQQISKLKKEIDSLKSAISKCKQFNKKVELNMALGKKETELETLLHHQNQNVYKI